FFFSSRRRHTRFSRDWSSDVCSSDLSQTSFGLFEPGCGPDVLERTLQFGLERLGAGLRERVPQVVHRTALVLRFGKVAPEGLERSEERRVGKGGRCRWAGCWGREMIS